jgi:hypothetical protein
MICIVAVLDDDQIVSNIEVTDTDNFGVKENYEKTNEAMRDWYTKIFPWRERENLVLLFTGEDCLIGMKYNEDPFSPVRFKERSPESREFKDSLGYWDEEYGRWFVWTGDTRDPNWVQSEENSNKADFIKNHPKVRIKPNAKGTRFKNDVPLGFADDEYNGEVEWF